MQPDTLNLESPFHKRRKSNSREPVPSPHDLRACRRPMWRKPCSFSPWQPRLEALPDEGQPPRTSVLSYTPTYTTTTIPCLTWSPLRRGWSTRATRLTRLVSWTPSPSRMNKSSVYRGSRVPMTPRISDLGRCSPRKRTLKPIKVILPPPPPRARLPVLLQHVGHTTRVVVLPVVCTVVDEVAWRTFTAVALMCDIFWNVVQRCFWGRHWRRYSHARWAV